MEKTFTLCILVDFGSRKANYMNKNSKHYVGFSKCLKIGPKRFGLLLNYFDSLENAWRGSISDFMKAGLDKNTAEDLAKHIENTDLDTEMERLEKLGAKILTLEDENYPNMLREIFLPPAILYVRGEILEEDENALSIVGARKVTDYGRQITKDLTYDLASGGLTIVSGLALGVDAVAHQAALEAKGRTIAVLGCGVDEIYPTTNTKLGNQIIESGAVISEFPLGTAPLKQNFPARNRIVSGLSLGTLVTEASEKSGALITARDALEQGREVFAVPGSLHNKNSAGPNNLIKMGAKPITAAKDIIEELNLENIASETKAKKVLPSTKEEEIILNIIESEPKHIDIIVKEGELEAAQASSTLTMMEIKGKVKNLGGMVYTIAR